MEIGSSTNERRLMRFVQMARNTPGIVRRDVMRSLKLTAKEMDAIEETAIERELITIGTKHGKGRPAKAYYTVFEGETLSTTEGVLSPSQEVNEGAQSRI